MQESNRIEFKRELTDALEKEVIAFLNYRDGGIIPNPLKKHIN
jgi:ATP-dependent DNA helicase RecG